MAWMPQFKDRAYGPIDKDAEKPDEYHLAQCISGRCHLTGTPADLTGRTRPSQRIYTAVGETKQNQTNGREMIRTGRRERNALIKEAEAITGERIRQVSKWSDQDVGDYWEIEFMEFIRGKAPAMPNATWKQDNIVRLTIR